MYLEWDGVLCFHCVGDDSLLFVFMSVDVGRGLFVASVLSVVPLSDSVVPSIHPLQCVSALFAAHSPRHMLSSTPLPRWWREEMSAISGDVDG